MRSTLALFNIGTVFVALVGAQDYIPQNGGVPTYPPTVVPTVVPTYPTVVPTNPPVVPSTVAPNTVTPPVPVVSTPYPDDFDGGDSDMDWIWTTSSDDEPIPDDQPFPSNYTTPTLPPYKSEDWDIDWDSTSGSDTEPDFPIPDGPTSPMPYNPSDDDDYVPDNFVPEDNGNDTPVNPGPPSDNIPWPARRGNGGLVVIYNGAVSNNAAPPPRAAAHDMDWDDFTDDSASDSDLPYWTGEDSGSDGDFTDATDDDVPTMMPAYNQTDNSIYVNANGAIRVSAVKGESKTSNSTGGKKHWAYHWHHSRNWTSHNIHRGDRKLRSVNNNKAVKGNNKARVAASKNVKNVKNTKNTKTVKKSNLRGRK